MGRIYPPPEANGRKDLPEFKLDLPDSLGNGVHLPQGQAQADLVVLVYIGGTLSLR